MRWYLFGSQFSDHVTTGGTGTSAEVRWAAKRATDKDDTFPGARGMSR